MYKKNFSDWVVWSSAFSRYVQWRWDYAAASLTNEKQVDCLQILLLCRTVDNRFVINVDWNPFDVLHDVWCIHASRASGLYAKQQNTLPIDGWIDGCRTAQYQNMHETLWLCVSLVLSLFREVCTMKEEVRLAKCRTGTSTANLPNLSIACACIQRGYMSLWCAWRYVWNYQTTIRIRMRLTAARRIRRLFV